MYKDYYVLFKIDNGNRDLFSIDHDFPFGDRLVVGEHQNRVILLRIQLDDGATAHPQQLVHGYDRTA